MLEQIQVFFLSLYNLSKILMIQIKKINIKENTQHKINDEKQRDKLVIKKICLIFWSSQKILAN
jgi:hypothetical protein